MTSISDDEKDVAGQLEQLRGSFDCVALIELVDRTLDFRISMLNATTNGLLDQSPSAISLLSGLLYKQFFQEDGLNHKYPRLFIAIIYNYIRFNTEKININDDIIAHVMSELIYYFDKITTNYCAIHQCGSIEKYRKRLKMYENNDDSNNLFYQSIINQIIDHVFFANKHIIDTMMCPLRHLIRNVASMRYSRNGKTIDHYLCHVLKNWIKLQNTYSVYNHSIATMRMIAHVIDHGMTAYIGYMRQNGDIDYSCTYNVCNRYNMYTRKNYFTSSEFYIENIVNKKIGRYHSKYFDQYVMCSNYNYNNKMTIFLNNLDAIVNVTITFLMKFLIFYKENPKKMKSKLDWHIFQMIILILVTCFQYYLWCNCDLSKIVSLCYAIKFHAFVEKNCARLDNHYTLNDRLEASMIKYFIKNDWHNFKKTHSKLIKFINEEIDCKLKQKMYKQFASRLRSMFFKSKNSKEMKIQTLCKINMYHMKCFSILKFNKYFKLVINCDDYSCNYNNNNLQNINETVRFFKNLSSFKECHWRGCLNKNKILKKCKNCQSVYYCSRLCQKLDWKMYYKCQQTFKYFVPHKQSCKNNGDDNSSGNYAGFKKRDCVWLSFDCIFALKRNGLLK